MGGAWSTLVHFRERMRVNNKILALVLALVIIFPSVGLAYMNGPQEVTVNGEVIGVVANQDVFKSALAEVTKAKSEALGGQTVELCGEVQFKSKLLAGDILDQADLIARLSQMNYAVKAIAIKANGETCAVVADEQAATQVLEQYKDLYTTPAENVEIKEVSFLETVTCEPVQVSVEEVLTPEEAELLIRSGKEEVITYTVQEGDCLWLIARANDLRVQDLMDANPELKSDKLSIGQTLRLVGPKPLLTVAVTLEKTATESINYPVEIKQTDDKLRGYRHIEQKGVPGKREVTYQIVRHNDLTIEENILNETIVQEPVKEIVLQGTRVAVASRGSDSGTYSAGSGQLAWPLRGGITSAYGYRGREFHTGMDIDGNTGDAIRAADDGKVTGAGWEGGYGKMITINHGNGIVTRYAHCSSINVKVGQRVSKGEVIGRVGSTGRSTGSHLHFEVLVNGNPVNPKRYLG